MERLQTSLERRREEAGKRKNKGFTLVELLIVIAILGILSAVVVISVSGINDRGQTSACKTDKNAIETAIESYYATNGGWPANAAALIPGFLSAAPDATYHTINYSAATPPARPTITNGAKCP